ncbi:MAG: MarR family transcriptional regulator [Hyphomicrobiales bacterium]|nr:MarR family transcriptional regulator [Hyphomicrobiales bacterium]
MNDTSPPDQATPGATQPASQSERVWFRLLRLQTRLHLVISERLRAVGLSVPQCDILTTLTEREGITQSELAERLYVTKGNISGLIDRLVAAGLVERRASAEDRRSHAVFLTQAGRDAAMTGIAEQRAFVRESLAMLPPEKLAAFEALIVDVRDVVRAADQKTRRRRTPEAP